MSDLVERNKELGQRSDAELEKLFGDMYSGWDRGVNVTQERFGNGDTRFTETPMTPLELAARYVAAEIGANIYEIANRAAFAPITVFSQIQARIGPVFDEAATALEAKAKEIEALREQVRESKQVTPFWKTYWKARAETAERERDEAIEALKPFAKFADNADDMERNARSVGERMGPTWSHFADLCRAARAITGED